MLYLQKNLQPPSPPHAKRFRGRKRTHTLTVLSCQGGGWAIDGLTIPPRPCPPKTLLLMDLAKGFMRPAHDQRQEKDYIVDYNVNNACFSNRFHLSLL